VVPNTKEITFKIVGDNVMEILFKKNYLAKTMHCGVTLHKTVYPKSVDSFSILWYQIDNVFFCR
jgi:hypothetical protein